MKNTVGSLQFRTILFIHTASSIPRDSSVLLSSFFTRSMVFAHIPKAQLLFALLSETFLTIRQNSLNVTVCMIARSSCRGYFIHSLSTLYYCNAPSLATRLTGDYRDRTYTGKCGPASLDTQNKKGNRKNDSSSCGFLVLPLLIPYTRGSLLLQDRFPA